MSDSLESALLRVLASCDETLLARMTEEHRAWAVAYAEENGAAQLSEEIADGALFAMSLSSGSERACPMRVALGLAIMDMIEAARVMGDLAP